MAGLEKAYLEIEGGDRVPCLYDPDTLSVGRPNSWVSTPLLGKGAPTLQYAGAAGTWMKVVLTFDTTDAGTAVTRLTDRVVNLWRVDPGPRDDGAGHPARPATVVFHWGELHSPVSQVTDLRLDHTSYSPDGVPLRATVRLELRQVEVPETAAEPSSPEPAAAWPARTHHVQSGETLELISARYYGHGGRWRVLASANGIDDPRDLHPGTTIRVPRLED